MAPSFSAEGVRQKHSVQEDFSRHLGYFHKKNPKKAGGFLQYPRLGLYLEEDKMHLYFQIFQLVISPFFDDWHYRNLHAL